ncbi:PadR family transcriptional regulator [Rubrobacter aplysinae]|uniref:PadR family transcriptional regulator n=1 Tax=Rubrobacter aplysinae TaxID=909625 RepID=UPI00064C2FE9|nr:PadR family transcriptional regulator [Rubrobacter aplysinae]
MDERHLLILGLVREQRQHGYQIHEFIQKNLSNLTQMKKATAYAVLDRLEGGGYVRSETEQQGNRPPRKVYEVTPEGREAFVGLLRENLSGADRILMSGDVGLMFLDELPKEEVAGYLEKRLDDRERQIAELEKAPEYPGSLGPPLAIEHLLALNRADRDWLRAVINRLRHEIA